LRRRNRNDSDPEIVDAGGTTGTTGRARWPMVRLYLSAARLAEKLCPRGYRVIEQSRGKPEPDAQIQTNWTIRCL
jgi:hypothetical protein